MHVICRSVYTREINWFIGADKAWLEHTAWFDHPYVYGQIFVLEYPGGHTIKPLALAALDPVGGA